jgi:hypothetical protein
MRMTVTVGSSRIRSRTSAFCFGFIEPSTVECTHQYLELGEELGWGDVQRTNLYPAPTRNGSITSNILVNYHSSSVPHSYTQTEGLT